MGGGGGGGGGEKVGQGEGCVNGGTDGWTWGEVRYSRVIQLG